MGSAGDAASQLKYRANRTLWRWTENTHPNRPAESNSRVEAIHPGKVIDWLPPNSVYIQLGWVTPIQ